jgi:hypothetical protein
MINRELAVREAVRTFESQDQRMVRASGRGNPALARFSELGPATAIAQGGIGCNRRYQTARTVELSSG